ncbi:hypothetical protein BX265_5614 [Streptomyces sp. TLI_235]|nr:phospholipase [Streptomyces sp. TLI_235]PBC71046.1 hypothetical protein BX265_5614 [Streptomyces sp. TLI_235]
MQAQGSNGVEQVGGLGDRPRLSPGATHPPGLAVSATPTWSGDRGNGGDDVLAPASPTQIRCCVLSDGAVTYHDCSSAGDNRLGPSFDSVIDRILSNASAGRRLALVWLDIKDPNYCGEQQNRGCSVAGLRDKAQRLTAAGIQVLYGFYEYHGGSTPDVGDRGWKSLEGRLGRLEGITTTGTRDQVRNAFNRSSAGFPAGRRGMDYGDSDITKGFGNCTEAGYNTCAELKKGAGDRAAGQLAATLSWTTTYNDPWYVDKLLGDAHVDGIIAGYGAFAGVREYDGSWQCANAVNLVRDWVNRHGATRRMATGGDSLFR